MHEDWIQKKFVLGGYGCGYPLHRRWSKSQKFLKGFGKLHKKAP